MSDWTDWFAKCIKFLESIQDIRGTLLLTMRRKTTIIGFIITILSTMAISKSLLLREVNPFHYILTHKFSQDHLEIFFNKIRQCGGWNNNPTTRQFSWSIRSILIKNLITASSTGNCISFDSLQESIFQLKSSRRRTPPLPNLDQSQNLPDDITLLSLDSIQQQTDIQDLTVSTTQQGMFQEKQQEILSAVTVGEHCLMLKKWEIINTQVEVHLPKFTVSHHCFGEKTEAV